MTTREELWVTHASCGHTWVIAYLPMEMARVARLMRGAHCPKCGETKELFMATNADIEVARQQARLSA